MRPEFYERFADAIRRRLAPNTRLHLKQLAGAIKVSDDTLVRWSRGQTRITAEALGTLAEFFRKRGDQSFLAEIYGDLVPPVRPDLTQLRAAIHDATRQLAAAEAMPSDVCYWVTDDGAMHHAPAGHREFARRILGFPAHLETDYAIYAIRTLGWVAVTMRANQTSAVIRYARDSIDPLAATRLCEFLYSESKRSLESAHRFVDIDRHWVAAARSDPATAADALAQAARIASSGARWDVTRHPIESATLPIFDELLKAYTNAEPLWAAALRLGISTSCSILRVEDGNVTPLMVGPGLGIRSAQRVGKNVMEWANTGYAKVVRDRSIAARQQPVYHHNDIPIDGMRCRYQTLALPDGEPNGPGTVFIASHVISKELITA
jgi:transcriptional regulator with XRE-family HTH domain